MFFHNGPLSVQGKTMPIPSGEEESKEDMLFSFLPAHDKNSLHAIGLELAPDAALPLPVAVVSQGQSLHHSE
jgi:hypothetical protein